ncbi:FecR family protein [Mucilaginibacter mali]|uniref:FecR family protein n=1 Tax=Mucilaginibacter mali TaxID=2740462 RepID=A0A7D4PUF7_9SPHI|nr:FecR family protein [Mucilaginibacter mali]QKJ30668.1 FecR family protein [Mucilaginibacter mali]
MDEQQLREYLQKLAEDKVTEAERALFREWAAKCSPEDYERMLEAWEASLNTQRDLAPVSNQLLERIAASLDEADGKIKTLQPEQNSRRIWQRIAVAASVLVVLGLGYYALLSNRTPKGSNMVAVDVKPGTGAAILKTGGGRHIVLDSASKGLIASDAGNNINKSADQQLTYSSSAQQAEPVYDTIQVPAGGKPYTLILGDGSRIMLNAATTLRFAENMSDRSRPPLELIAGEIYAEIRHHADAPLTINTAKQVIEDLGTSFNVSAYPDEENSTTLEEGSVRVNDKLLVPGKAAVSAGSTTTIREADVEQILAWTKGYFRFNGEDIQTIMRQLARWYNIEVVYEGKVTTEGFYGKISRSKNISEVLKMLEKTKSVHFKIEGRRVTVSSKS